MKAMILLFLVMALPAHAAQERGNGGDGFLCQDGKVYFYDLVEMEKRYHIAPEIPAGANWQEITARLINRLQPINPSRALRFHQRLSSFLTEADFLSGVNLIDVPDTGIGFVPNGCELKQLVIQRPPKFPGEKRYVVAKDLWDRLDENNRAVLVLHEMILGDAIEDEHQTSESSRYLNGLITGNQLGSKTPKAYVDLLRQLRFSNADYAGVSISIPSSKWEGERLLEAGTPAHVYVDQQGIHGTAECSSESGLVKFTSEGRLREFFARCNERHLAYSLRTPETLVNGNLLSLNVLVNGTLAISLQGGKTEITHPLLHVSVEREDVWTGLNLGAKGDFRSIRTGCTKDVDVRCPSFAEVFYRDQWRKASQVEIDGGKVRDVTLDTPVRAKLGWMDVSYDQVYTDTDIVDYSLTGVNRIQFTNASLRLERVQMNLLSDRVKNIVLGEKFHFTSKGITYYCDRGDFLGVNGRSLVLNTDGPCRDYQ